MALWIQHWFPWWRKLHRIEAYILGVGAILIGQGVWLLKEGRQAEWLELVTFCAVSGAAVGLSYGVDWLLNLRLKAQLKDGDDKTEQE